MSAKYHIFRPSIGVIASLSSSIPSMQLTLIGARHRAARRADPVAGDDGEMSAKSFGFTQTS
jgi:hypothetical protein